MEDMEMLHPVVELGPLSRSREAVKAFLAGDEKSTPVSQEMMKVEKTTARSRVLYQWTKKILGVRTSRRVITSTMK